MGNFYASDKFEIRDRRLCPACGQQVWLVAYRLGSAPQHPDGVLPGHDPTEWVHCENPDSDLNYLTRKCEARKA